MPRFLVGAFIVLHGLVHLLYFGQGWRLFQLQPDMAWPAGSWAFAKLLGDEAARWLASVSCIAAAIGFVAGGAGIFAGQAWWRPLVVGSAAFSTAIWILFWDGTRQELANQGAIAIAINLAMLCAVLVVGWPDFGF